MTHCVAVEIGRFNPSQYLVITRERKKAHPPDHFCLTELVPQSYFAGSPPCGCGGKEAASAMRCVVFVDRVWFTWGWIVDSTRMASCV